VMSACSVRRFFEDPPDTHIFQKCPAWSQWPWPNYASLKGLRTWEMFRSVYKVGPVWNWGLFCESVKLWVRQQGSNRVQWVRCMS
jgi:hypothetical protein